MKLPAVNPIFTRVLTASGRKARHVWTRTVYMAAILAALLVMMTIETAGAGGAVQLADVGELLFVTVSMAQLLMILVLSPIYTAGAISQERDAQTFSVLLATPLSNLQIILGSLLSRLFFILAILFSTLPIFALLYYFGGFELRDVVLSYAIAASTALLTGSVAIAVSITATGTRRVMIGFFLFIIAYVLGLYAVDHMLLPSLWPGHTAGSLDWLHPLGAMLSAISAGENERLPLDMLSFRQALVVYPEYGYLVYSVGLSLAIIGLAAALVRRLARGYGGVSQRVGRVTAIAVAAAAAMVLFAIGVQRVGPAGSALGLLLLAVPVALGVLLVRMKRHRKPRGVWDNPVAWRERVTRTSTSRRTVVQLLYVVLSVLALYVVLVMKVAGAPAEQARQLVFYVTSVQMFVVLMVGATMAASSVSYEREQGTLDILLTTPITPRYFIHGKLMGIIRYLGLFIGMILLVTSGALVIGRLPVERLLGGLVPASWVAAIRAVPARPGAEVIRWDQWPLASVVYTPLVTGALGAAMVALGMTFSLRARSTARAAVHASLSVLGVAATLTCCCGLSGMVYAVGPIVAMASPFWANMAALMPETFMLQYDGTFGGSEPMRSFFLYFGMHLGLLMTVGGYLLFSWTRLRGMVRTFDLQTRQKV